MRNFLKSTSMAVILSTIMSSAALADTIKVGVIASFSGPNAIWGKQFKEAIEVYQAVNGKTVGGHTVEFIYKDLPTPNPDASKALAQELLVKDQVKYIGGFNFTPDALAVAPLATQAKVPTVIFNAATSIITQKSDYFVRSSFTLWQVTVPVANWAYDNGARKVITAVADYGPGIDGETAFKSAFTKKGGTITESIRMPLATNDFAPFMQRIKDSGANAVYAFLPAGPQTFAFTKAYNENGLKAAGITFYGTGETDETTLDALGDAAIGLTTAYHYSGSHDSPENKAFTSKLEAMFPGARANLGSVGAYDGTHLIYKMIEKTGTDSSKGIDAIKGLSWISPRGPVSIDPTTRHITQNVYMRKVDKDANGRLINKEFDTIKDVPDLGLQAQ